MVSTLIMLFRLVVPCLFLSAFGKRTDRELELAPDAAVSAAGNESSKWQCTCQTWDGKNNIFYDEAMCKQVMNYAALDEKSGKTCISHDELFNSCWNQMHRWWIDTIGPAETPYPLAIHKLWQQLRNEPLIDRIRSAYPCPNRINPEGFANLAADLCVEVGFRHLTTKRPFTTEGGKGALTDVFGEYTLSHDKIMATRNIGVEDAPTIVVGGLGVVREHPIFKRIRDFFKIPNDFLLGADLSQVDTSIEAGSGSIFIKHGIYLIKGERVSDWHSQVDWLSFHEMTNDYADWIMTQRDTLIPRFFTAFYDEKHEIYYFVMQNWIPAKWTNSARIYDFKGSNIPSKRGDTNSRMVKITPTISSKDVSEQVLKDLNFLGNKIYVPHNVRALLVEQLAADTAWLAKHNLMDYSLVLQEIQVGICDKPSLNHVCSLGLNHPFHSGVAQMNHGFLVGVTPEDSRMYIYALGLIDILQPYSVFKAVGTAYDKVKFPQQVGKNAMNNIPPVDYQERFEKFFEDMMEPVQPINCTAYVDQLDQSERGDFVGSEEKSLSWNKDFRQASIGQ